MRALEKDRTRRYDSPQELAADIERHLRDQPVLAGPPSMAYRAKKFVRRHKVGVGVAAAGLAVLIAFVGAMAYQANRIARERDRASQEAETAKQVSDFLVELFEVSDPGEARGNEVTAREIMDKGAERVRTELSDQPLVQARLLYAMGSVYLNLGLFEEARGPLEDSWRTRRSLLGESDAETIESADRLSSLLWAIGDSEESQRLARSTLEILERTREPDDEQLLRVMKNLGLYYVHAGNYNDAEPLLLEAMEGLSRLRGERHPDTLAAQNDLAMLYLAVGRFDEAIDLNTEILAKRRDVLGDDHPDTVEVMQNLGVAYQYAGRLDEAEPLFVESLDISRRVRPDHPDTLISRNNLAILYRDLGRLADAEQLLVEVVDSHRDQMGDDHPGTLMTLGNLGEIYTLQGRYDRAERHLVRAVEGLRATHENPVVKGYTIRKLGACLTGQRRFDEAQSMLLEAHEMLVQTVGPEHPQTAKAARNLVELYEAWNRPAEAEQWRSRLPVEFADGASAARREG
jgi:non-specific serine/threonine protein kinase/serine/threonine-protein kinase